MLLKDNPFYVLDVSLSADRRKIANATEEMGFLLGSDKCSEAQSALTSPSKRLQAEMDWFPNTEAAEIAKIRDAVSNDQLINTSRLADYARLNALIHNLGITTYSSIYELGFDLVAIDEQYNEIEISAITLMLNRARSNAGFTSVSENDVLEYHRKKIEDIRKLVNEKIKPYDEKTYISFVTIIAEKYIADKRYESGAVLADVVDQYEVRMQSALDEKTNQVKRYIETIKSEQSEDVVKKSIPKLIERVKEWDVYAQPLQLRSQASGLPHETSQDLAGEIRGLCLYLNNDKKMTSEAKMLASAMQSVFLELGELKEVFTGDTEKLTEIENDQKNAGVFAEIKSELDIIKNTPHHFYILNNQTVDLIEKAKNLNTKIRSASFNPEMKLQLRKAVCFAVREKAIELNNESHQPSIALYIIEALLSVFDDVAELRSKLSADRDQLIENARKQNAPQFNPTRSNTTTKKQSNKAGWIILLAIVGLIVISNAISNNSNNKNRSSYSSNSSYTTSSKSTSKATEKPTTKPTAKPTVKKEAAYSLITSSLNDSVYVDVVSVFPAHGIYRENSLSYHTLVCECKTSDGNKVWVSFSTSDYKKYIDSNVNTFVTSSNSADTIYFSPAARIHGKVSRTENVLNGLSARIGSTTIITFASIDITENKKTTITIKSIFPSYTITSGSSGTVTHVLCEYTNNLNMNHWIYMSINQYKKLFDSSFNPGKSASKKTYSTAKRFEVYSEYVDSLCDGGSTTIGQDKVYVLPESN